MFVAPVVRAGVLGSPSRCDLCYRTSSAVAMAPRTTQACLNPVLMSKFVRFVKYVLTIRLIKAVHCDHMALLDAHAPALDLHHQP